VSVRQSVRLSVRTSCASVLLEIGKP